MATLLEVPIEGMTPFGYNNNGSFVRPILLEQFPQLKWFTPSGWNDWACVQSGGGDYLRMRTRPGDAGHKHAAIPLSQTVDTAVLRYSFYLESTGGSGHPADDGFDWGNGDGVNPFPKTALTGIKFPGLMKGEPDNNTGGVIVPGNWSGRGMGRGNRKSDGVGGLPREGVGLEAYLYVEEIGGVAAGVQQSYRYVGSHSEEPTKFGTNPGGTSGTGNGQYGDPRQQELNTDTWYHICIQYHVPDSAGGFYKAWTWEEGVDTAWREQLHIPNIRYMAAGNSGIDHFLLQTFWGGDDPENLPDSSAHMRFRNFGVYTEVQEAMDAFGLGVSVPFEITSPTDGATNVGTPLTPVASANLVGQGYQFQLDSQGWSNGTHNGIDTVTGNPIPFLEDGGTHTIQGRRWS